MDKKNSFIKSLKKKEGIEHMDMTKLPIYSLVNEDGFPNRRIKTEQDFFSNDSCFEGRSDRQFSLGKLGTSVNIQSFSLSEFDEKKASGFVRLIKCGDKLRIQIVTTHGHLTRIKKEQLLLEGFIKVNPSQNKESRD